MKTETPTSIDRALNEDQAAEFLGLSRASLRIARSTGNRENRFPAPPYFKIGRAVRYSLNDLTAYRESFRIDPAAEGGE